MLPITRPKVAIIYRKLSEREFFFPFCVPSLFSRINERTQLLMKFNLQSNEIW